MYKIEKTHYGVKLIFADAINKDEMATWVEESKKVLTTMTGKFGVFVDMRTLKPLQPDAQEEMQKGQKLFKQAGMERSVVILDSALITMQFKKIAQETGIYEWERYINASAVSNWEEVGVKWIKDAVDPD